MSYTKDKVGEKLWAFREGVLADNGEGREISRELGVTEAFGRLMSLRGYKTPLLAEVFCR